jgi:hypothetical protein
MHRWHKAPPWHLFWILRKSNFTATHTRSNEPYVVERCRYRSHPRFTRCFTKYRRDPITSLISLCRRSTLPFLTSEKNFSCRTHGIASSEGIETTDDPADAPIYDSSILCATATARGCSITGCHRGTSNNTSTFTGWCCFFGIDFCCFFMDNERNREYKGYVRRWITHIRK